jgi:hypothetical protein
LRVCGDLKFPRECLAQKRRSLKSTVMQVEVRRTRNGEMRGLSAATLECAPRYLLGEGEVVRDEPRHRPVAGTEQEIFPTLGSYLLGVGFAAAIPDRAREACHVPRRLVFPISDDRRPFDY